MMILQKLMPTIMLNHHFGSQFKREHDLMLPCGVEIMSWQFLRRVNMTVQLSLTIQQVAKV